MMRQLNKETCCEPYAVEESNYFRSSRGVLHESPQRGLAARPCCRLRRRAVSRPLWTKAQGSLARDPESPSIISSRATLGVEPSSKTRKPCALSTISSRSKATRRKLERGCSSDCTTSQRRKATRNCRHSAAPSWKPMRSTT